MLLDIAVFQLARTLVIFHPEFVQIGFFQKIQAFLGKKKEA